MDPTTRSGTIRRLVAGAAALALTALLVAVATPGSAAGSGAPRFAKAVKLKGAQGAEPSLAINTFPGTKGFGDIYVAAIGDPNGPDEWHSYTGGRTWSKPVPFDLSGPARGGDQDVVVNTNGNLIATDLNVSHASVQISSNRGKSFDAGTQTAPEDDRPWLTADGPNVYVAYHDFVAEDPIVCISRDGGATFGACNQVFGPGQSSSQCAENTVPSRPLVVDPVTYSLNFLYSCSTQAENAQHPPYGPLHDYYLAQSTDGSTGSNWTTFPVFLADTSNGKVPNYANIFGTLGIDSRGNYYALFDGTSDDRTPKQHPYHVYLAISKNHGHTWSKPIQVDHDRNGRGTHELADFVVTSPGNVDVVWYGTSRTGEPNGVCGTLANQTPCKDGFPNFGNKRAPKWHVFMAQSRNLLSPRPTWTQVMVNPAVSHYGRICSNGIVCGNSDRSLLDYISVAVDCRGFAHIVYATNTKKQDKNGVAYVRISNQVGGSRIHPPVSCG